MSLHSEARLVDSLEARSFVKTDQRRYEPALRGVALFGADCLALLVAVGGGLLVGRIFASYGMPLPLAIDSATKAEWLVLVVGMFGYFAQQGRYSERTPFWFELRSVACAGLCSAFAFSCIGIMSGNFVSRIETVVALLIFPVFAAVANHYAKALLSRTGLWETPIIIIGNGESARKAEAALKSDASLGLKVVRRIDPEFVLSQSSTFNIQSLMEWYRAQSVLIAVDGNPVQQKQLINAALQERISFAIVPEANSLPVFSHCSKIFIGHNVMFFTHYNALSKKLPLLIKSTFDVTTAAALILFLSPVYIIVAALTALDGGPVIFRQTRIGAGGRRFSCLKFRTMVVDAEQVLQDALAKDPVLANEWHVTRKLTNDPRITRIGKILRKTSLDELPQLFNILLLQMSLVGPRPIVESEIKYYGDNIAQYYATRPGLTGLWQVSGRSDTTYAQRVELDTWYVNNWTIWGDIIVLLKTFPAVMGARGAR